jgi:hypothetical protein
MFHGRVGAESGGSLQTTGIYVRAEKKRMMEVASKRYKKD